METGQKENVVKRNAVKRNAVKTFKESQEDEIRDLLMGHRIVNAEVFTEGVRIEGTYSEARGKLTLDNGQEVYVVPNEGGCSCGAGDYSLSSLDRVDNLITRVDFEATDEGPDQWEKDTVYRIFVLAGHERINLLSVAGSDGNGYYGTGYELMVIPAL